MVYMFEARDDLKVGEGLKVNYGFAHRNLCENKRKCCTSLYISKSVH